MKENNLNFLKLKSNKIVNQVRYRFLVFKKQFIFHCLRFFHLSLLSRELNSYKISKTKSKFLVEEFLWITTKLKLIKNLNELQRI